MRLLFGISILWIGLSMTSESVTALVLPDAIEDEVVASYEATIVGLVSFLALALAALVQPIAGLISDRLRPRWTRLRFVGFILLPVVLAIGAFGFAGSLLVLIASYLFLLVTLSALQAGFQSLLPDLIPAEKRGMAAGTRGFFDLIGAMLGFALLGALLEMEGRAFVMITSAAAMVILFLVTLVLVKEASPQQIPYQRTTPAGFSRLSLASAFGFGSAPRAVAVRLLTSRFFFLLGTYAIGRFMLLFFAHILGVDEDDAEAEAGAVLAGLAFFTAISSPLGGWLSDHWGRVPTMVAGSSIGAIGALLFVVAANQPHVLIFGLLLATGGALFASANWAAVADLAPAEGTAQFLGLANLGTSAAVACAGLLGPLIDLGNKLSVGLGYDLLFVVSAGAMGLSAVIAKGLEPGRLPAHPPVRKESKT